MTTSDATQGAIVMSDEITARQLVVFTLGSEHYALPIGEVHEIIRYTEPRSVASRVDWVRGVISLRGRIVPVYDIAARLGISSQLTENTKIVIVEAGSETAGVIVDSVEEVLTVETSQIEEAPGADTTLIESIARVGKRLIVLLTLNTIFASPDLLAA
jgi:purine-binding chemotaxis protein CheW